MNLKNTWSITFYFSTLKIKSYANLIHLLHTCLFNHIQPVQIFSTILKDANLFSKISLLILVKNIWQNSKYIRGEYSVWVPAQARRLSFSKSGLFRLSFTQHTCALSKISCQNDVTNLWLSFSIPTKNCVKAQTDIYSQFMYPSVVPEGEKHWGCH